MAKFKKNTVKKSISKSYSGIIPFINKKFSPLEFESYCNKKFNLFCVDSNFDFKKTETEVDYIISRLPSIKKIFSKPLIDLIDINNVMPVESVRKIYSKTIEYAINHSNTIDNIYKDKSIKPRKLLSVEYNLLYETYENRTFTYLINLLLRYTKRNILMLNNYLFINKDEINLNLLERLNHPEYYLAAGKLHTSYIRNFNNSFGDITRLMKKLKLIYNTINSRLKSKVYVKCNAIKKANKRYMLKKTNIFRNQKDYKNIYNLLRYMLINYDFTLNNYYEDNDIKKLEKPYFAFVEILLVFSLIHFNYSIQSNKKISFTKLDLNLKFKSFHINVKKKTTSKINYLNVTFKKDKKYTICLYCGFDNKTCFDNVNKLKEMVKADEYIVLSPYLSNDDSTYISVNNIDSFRRLQQIVLRGMVYSDSRHDTCPFCGERLTRKKTKIGFVYACDKCRTQIQKVKCPNTKKYYYSTTITNYKNYVLSLKEDKKHTWNNSHDIENQMYFRNINKLNSSMEEICPLCNDVHSSSDLTD